MRDLNIKWWMWWALRGCCRGEGGEQSTAFACKVLGSGEQKYARSAAGCTSPRCSSFRC